ncbi:MAG: hypothetical protein H3C45_04360 [Bacteroidia bacterium]|nr:hypothetical protein [Bacteroidia bacterium]
MAVSFLNNPNVPRGIRNNNPGNLRRTGIDWQGKIPLVQSTDNAFEQFQNIHYGLRAMATDITNDIVLKKLNTIEKLVTQYAPPNENDTTAYIKYVSKNVGIKPNTIISLSQEVLKKIMLAKIKLENGENYVASLLPDIGNMTDTAIAAMNESTKARLTETKIINIAPMLIIGLTLGFFLLKSR